MYFRRAGERARCAGTPLPPFPSRTRPPPAHAAPPTAAALQRETTPEAHWRRTARTGTSALRGPAGPGTGVHPPGTPASPDRPAFQSPPRTTRHRGGPETPSGRETPVPLEAA